MSYDRERKMVGRKCRVWWPEQLSCCELDSPLLLFGWHVLSASNSLDIVVAFGVSPHELSLQVHLQDFLQNVNERMPISLQDQSTLSVLGHCAVVCVDKKSNLMDDQNNDLSFENLKGELQCLGMEEGAVSMMTSHHRGHQHGNQELSGEATFAESRGEWNCGCRKLDRLLEQHRQSSIRNGNWIQLISDSLGFSCGKAKWIPKLHHMHLNGQQIPICHVHPSFGMHHFSLSTWSSLEHVGIPMKKPNWVNELYKKKPLLDLDMIIMAINCARAAEESFKTCLGTTGFMRHNSKISMLTVIAWHVMAISVATVATLIYIILQFCHKFLVYGSQSLFYMILVKVFNHTWKNVHIRSCQLLYWPIFLQESNLRSQSNTEYAHRAALRKHAVWSSVAVDFLLGSIVGLALFVCAEAVSFRVSQIARISTNSLLLSGCVWLMGVPAGFKLNTELAELLGIVSLNAIHIWSTLCFFMGSLFRYFIVGLALSGMFLGMTVPAALCVDMLKLATFHISTLHWLISFLYSQQIQALASLWRLFRGQKWNPLRLRLDSYDYTVEQHVVGSLIFTPILLLLPTTSVFYIFFTIMNSTVNFICIVIEVTISIHHATPYAEIFLWTLRKRRFPSGVWFKITSRSTTETTVNPESGENFDFSNSDTRHRGPDENRASEVMALILQSNFAEIGQIIRPYYRNVFAGMSVSSGLSSIYGILSGQRVLSTLQMGLPPTFPWTSISFREYWRLCHSSVLSCRP